MNHRRFLPLLSGLLALCLLISFSGCSLLKRRRAQDSETSTRPGATRIVTKRSKDKGLSVELKTDPDPVRLGEVREIKVTFVVRNTGKTNTTLKFPTGQVMEIVLRDVAADKVVSQWSTDRTFAPEARYLVVNPGERLEYNEPITTRELKAGKTYSLEAYFIGYDPELRASRAVIPQP